MSRIFSILWTVGLSGQVLAGAPGDAAPEVTIEVTGIASSHGLDRVTLSRLLAWKKGELCRAQGYGFSVGRIVSGKLYDPGYPDRPVGTNHLDVILVDDALNALRAPGGRGARGTWTLTELPDGQYVVSDVEDTPMRGLDVGSKKKQADEIEKALRSGVPEQQLQALDRLEEVN